MSWSPEDVAAFKAAAYSKNGTCADEAKKLRQAARDLAQARLALKSARHNMGGASITTMGAAGSQLVCLTTPFPANFVCLAAAGLATIGSIVWSQSSLEAYWAAQGEYEDQEEAFREAMKKFCQCLHKH